MNHHELGFRLLSVGELWAHLRKIMLFSLQNREMPLMPATARSEEREGGHTVAFGDALAFARTIKAGKEYKKTATEVHFCN